MKKSACSAVICQPGGREQKHDISKILKRLSHGYLATGAGDL